MCVYLVCCLLALSLAPSLVSPSAPSKYIDKSQFFRWDVGLDGISGKLAAFTDFNNDKSADVILISANDSHTEIGIFAWNRPSFTFGLLDVVNVPMAVESVIPSDFNKDGYVDLLLQGKDSSGVYYIADVYLGYGTKLAESPCAAAHVGSTSELLLFDFDSNLRVDLMGTNLDNERIVWKNVPSSNQCGFEFQEVLFSTGDTFSTDDAHSFVDLNGDCLSDLLVVTQNEVNPDLKFFEVWIKDDVNWTRHDWSAQSKFFSAPAGAGMVSWIDVDGDGNMDLVFPVCWPIGTCASENSIHIIYNVQKTMCSSSKDSDSCRSMTSLCVADNNFELGSVPNSGDYIVVPLSDDSQIRFTGEIDFPFHYLRVQPGDIDLDGYPDLLVFITNGSSPTSQNGATILWNNPCDSTCSTDARGKGRRYFSTTKVSSPNILPSSLNALSSIPYVYGGAIFDIDDDGTQDIILLSFNSAENFYETVTIINNFDADALFLKSVGLNGVCPSYCPNGESFPDPKPYGVNQPGVVTKFYVTDIDGNYLPRMGVQLSQSSHGSLQAPYAMFGLGRTNNYVEILFMGFPAAGGQANKYYYHWNGMIPNSQIIVFPYPEDNPSSWTMELIINPSDSVVYVIIALVATILVLLITVAVLQWKENRQDQDEKKKKDHMFTF